MEPMLRTCLGKSFAHFGTYDSSSAAQSLHDSLLARISTLRQFPSSTSFLAFLRCVGGEVFSSSARSFAHRRKLNEINLNASNFYPLSMFSEEYVHFHSRQVSRHSSFPFFLFLMVLPSCCRSFSFLGVRFLPIFTSG